MSCPRCTCFSCTEERDRATPDGWHESILFRNGERVALVAQLVAGFQVWIGRKSFGIFATRDEAQKTAETLVAAGEKGEVNAR